MHRRQVLIVFIIACTIHLMLYLGALPTGRLGIDDDELVRIPQIQNPVSIQTLKAIWTVGTGIDYYPVRDLSYLVDAHLLGNTELAYRADQFLIFYATCFLLFCCLSALGAKAEIALSVAIFWLLHPVHSEMLIWISARKDLLAIFFAAGSTLLFIRGIQKSSVLFFGLALVVCIASILSKSSFTALPIVAVVYVLSESRLRRSKWLIGCACALVVSLASAAFSGWFYSVVNEMRAFHPLDFRVKASLAGLGREFAGWIWPPFNILDTEHYASWLFDNQSFIAVGGLVWLGILLLIVIAIRQRSRRLFFSMITFVALYLPTSGLLFPHRNFYSVRYFEVPMLAIVVGIGPLVAGLIYRQNIRARVVGATVLVIGFLAAGRIEAEIWDDPVAPFTHGLEQIPHAVRLQGIKLNALLRTSMEQPPTPEITREIAQIRDELKRACEGDHIVSETGDSCWGYYLTAYTLAADPQYKQKQYQAFQKSFAQWKPQSGMVSRVQIENDFFRHAINEDLLSTWLRNRAYFPNVAYRKIQLKALCALGRVKESQEQGRKYLREQLISKADLVDATGSVRGCQEFQSKAGSQ